MKTTNQFTDHFLVAMPSLQDSTFNKSVVYLYEHGDNGAMGVLINKPMQINLGNVFSHLGIEVDDDDAIEAPVLMGGPVNQEHGFILYRPNRKKKTQAKQEIELTASKEMLNKIAHGKGPNDFIVTLGYSGWGSGQLESEIERNDWLIVPANRGIIFDVPISQRWQSAAKLIGVDINNISSQTGHA